MFFFKYWLICRLEMNKATGFDIVKNYLKTNATFFSHFRHKAGSLDIIPRA
jgi:hypothetical protein